MLNGINQANGFQNRFEFLNREKESTFNLNAIRLGARMYNPTIARFDRVDPVTKEQEQYSLYQYGWNNPVLRSDPNGDCPICPALPFMPEIIAGATAVGEFIAGTVVGAAIGKGIKELVELGAGSGVSTYSPAVSLAMSTSKPGELTSTSSRMLNSSSKTSSSGGANTSSGSSSAGGSSIDPKNKKTYQTYTKTNEKTGEVYSGKTSGTKDPRKNIENRDSKPDHQEKNRQGYGPAELDKTSKNSDAIRGREQYLIDKNGGAQSQGGTSGNKYNSISPSNKKAEQYKAASKKEFGT